MAPGLNRAVFLDRDGVLIEDVDLLTGSEQLRILSGVPSALNLLVSAGFQLLVVSNQTVVARGLATEAEVRRINRCLSEMLVKAGGPELHGWYFCPHHPSATVAAYRLACECRKPRIGLFLQAANEHQIDLRHSFAVGDRVTDIIAGKRAGCTTVLVQTGKHLEPPIQTAEPIDTSVGADYICPDLAAAADWIVRNK